jgi:glycosyltransferase involved in cell wall biosynthesis
MRLSLYTFVKNGIFFDFHVEAMLRHHLPLADEIIVNEGYSTDDTYERITRIDPKIKVFRSEWGAPDDFTWFTRFKNAARERCTGDWCLYLDCDEFIPEWEFDDMRRFIETTTLDTAPLEILNFYANYRVYHAAPRNVNWAARKIALHRNIPAVHFWGDGSNVRVEGVEPAWELEGWKFSLHHFGYVRNPARLREKWRNIQSHMYRQNRLGRWLKVPSAVFSLLPHRWDDPYYLPDLAIYPGPHIKAVRDDPEEFVRDGMKMYEMLANREKGQRS